MAILTLAAVSIAALLRTSMSSSAPLTTVGAEAPRPQNGVWALMPSDCEAPTGLDLAVWPKCATPIGFLDDEISALERPGPGKKATPDQFYSIGRTKYVMAPAGGADGPAIAEIAVPMVFSRSYYYLAIKPEAVGSDGHFVTARGWPVACLPKDQGGCTPKSLVEVQTQATAQPTDPARVYRLIRIQPAAQTEGPQGVPPAPAAGEIKESPLPPPPAPAATQPQPPT